MIVQVGRDRRVKWCEGRGAWFALGGFACLDQVMDAGADDVDGAFDADEGGWLEDELAALLEDDELRKLKEELKDEAACLEEGVSDGDAKSDHDSDHEDSDRAGSDDDGVAEAIPPLVPPVPPAPFRCTRDQAMVALKEVYDKDAICEALQMDLEEEGTVAVDRVRRERLGKIYSCWGMTLCGTCRSHPHCKVMISCKDADMLLHVECDFLKWIALGSAVGADAHKAEAKSLRLGYGVKVRS